MTATEQQIRQAQQIMKDLGLDVTVDETLTPEEHQILHDFIGSTISLVTPESAEQWEGQYTEALGAAAKEQLGGNNFNITILALDIIKSGVANSVTLAPLQGVLKEVGIDIDTSALGSAIGAADNQDGRLEAALSYFSSNTEFLSGWENFPAELRDNPTKILDVLKQIKNDPTIIDSLGAVSLLQPAPELTADQIQARTDASAAMVEAFPALTGNVVEHYETLVETLEDEIVKLLDSDELVGLTNQIDVKKAELEALKASDADNGDTEILKSYTAIQVELFDALERFQNKGTRTDEDVQALKEAIAKTRTDLQAFIDIPEHAQAVAMLETDFEETFAFLNNTNAKLNGEKPTELQIVFPQAFMDRARLQFEEFNDPPSIAEFMMVGDILRLETQIDQLGNDNPDVQAKRQEMIHAEQILQRLKISTDKFEQSQTELTDDDVTNDNWNEIIPYTIHFLQSQEWITPEEGKLGVFTPENLEELRIFLYGDSDAEPPVEPRINKDEDPRFEPLDNFYNAMSALIASEAYNTGAEGLTPEQIALETQEEQNLTKQEAQAILGPIFGTIGANGLGISEVTPNADDIKFGMAERIALQAFILDLQRKGKGENGEDLEAIITLENGRSGLYTDEFKTELQRALANPAKLRQIKNRYFRDSDLTDEQITQLVAAIDTYTQNFDPNLAEAQYGSNISEDELITEPDLSVDEEESLKAALDNLPQEDMQAMNGFVQVLTGFGLEDFAAAQFSAEELTALESMDRQAAFEGLFARVVDQADEELLNDKDALATELKSDIIARVNALLADNSGFSTRRLSALRQDIRDAVDKAMDNYDPENPEAIELAALTFAEKLPTPSEFLSENGANTRDRGLIRPSNTYSVAPSEIQGIFGHAAGDPSRDTFTVEDAIKAVPTMQSSIDQILGPRLTGLAEETGQIVREGRTQGAGQFQGLKQLEELMIQTYQDALEDERVRGPNGALIVETLSNETYLITNNEGSIEIRYLDMEGIDHVEGVETVNINELTNSDDILIRAASARYEQINEGREKYNHRPAFFELDGRGYIVGIDKDTNRLEIYEIDKEFFNEERLQRILDAEDPKALREEWARGNEAYAFLLKNYAFSTLNVNSSKDPYFTLLTENSNSDLSDTVRERLFEVVGHGYGHDYPEGTGSEVSDDVFASAEASGLTISFGPAITDIASLNGLLGYNPEALFLSSVSEANQYKDFIVHGLEPEITLEGEGHEFFRDNVLVTRRNEATDIVETFTVPRELFDNNGYILEELLGVNNHNNGDLNVANRFANVGGVQTVVLGSVGSVTFNETARQHYGVDTTAADPFTPAFLREQFAQIDAANALTPDEPITLPDPEHPPRLETSHITQPSLTTAKLIKANGKDIVGGVDLSDTSATDLARDASLRILPQT